MRTRIWMMLMLLAFTANASVYKSVSPNGEITYSDMPKNGAVEFDAPPINQVPSTLDSAESSQGGVASATSTDNQPYTIFQIESPRDQETIQNQPTFTVQLRLEPALKAGDKIQLMLDDQPFGNPQTVTQIKMENVNRGTHRLYAVILDGQGQLAKRSNEITIFVHLPGLLNRPGSASRHPVHVSPLLTLIKHAKALLVASKT